MIQFKRYKTFLVLAVCVVLAACNIDDIKPYYQLTDDNTVRDESSAENVLNGIYKQWRSFDTGFFNLHLAAIGIEGVITGGISGQTGMNVNEVPVDNPYLASIYNIHYKVINQSNFLIEALENNKAEGISDTRKNELLSEAKFNRALAHFRLLTFFGQFYDSSSPLGIVIQDAFSRDVVAKERNTVAEVYDFIINDLNFATNHGPQYVAHYYGGRVTSEALLSKALLYAKRFEESANHALNVIQNNEGYSLTPNYESIFQDTYQSEEVLFALYHNSPPEGGTAMDQVSRTTFSPMLQQIADESVDGDGDLSGNGTGYDPRFSFAYAQATKGSNQNGKFPFSPYSANSPRNTQFFMRMAEVYLIYAEAETRKQNGDIPLALESLNEVRRRVSLNDLEITDKETLLNGIRKEKLLELFFENGEGWFDLIRYHSLGNISAFSEKSSLKNVNQFIFPIPLQVLTANNKMTPNPGY